MGFGVKTMQWFMAWWRVTRESGWSHIEKAVTRARTEKMGREKIETAIGRKVDGIQIVQRSDLPHLKANKAYYQVVK